MTLRLSRDRRRSLSLTTIARIITENARRSDSPAKASRPNSRRCSSVTTFNTQHHPGASPPRTNIGSPSPIHMVHRVHCVRPWQSVFVPVVPSCPIRRFRPCLSIFVCVRPCYLLSTASTPSTPSRPHMSHPSYSSYSSLPSLLSVHVHIRLYSSLLSLVHRVHPVHRDPSPYVPSVLFVLFLPFPPFCPYRPNRKTHNHCS